MVKIFLRPAFCSLQKLSLEQDEEFKLQTVRLYNYRIFIPLFFFFFLVYLFFERREL